MTMMATTEMKKARTSSGWAVISEKHVVPVDDIRDHITDVTCWCQPSEDRDHRHLWVHQSADGRERREHLRVVGD